MDEFNFDNAARFLAGYKDIEPERTPRASVKQTIIKLAPLIRELMERGYTQKQILDLLKQEYGLKLEYGTFRNYLNQAKDKRTEEEAEISENKANSGNSP